MAIDASLIKAEGSWTGTSRLFLPWLPEGEQIKVCDSTLKVQVAPESTYALVTYDWSIDGEPQEGAMVVSANSNGHHTAGWSDSWHQNSSVLFLLGTGKGTRMEAVYSNDDEGSWTWSVELRFTQEEELNLFMTNIHPGGQEDWAVDASYRRASHPGGR
ncbi:MAG TPA: DUF1579 family protein [Fimbriimonas sp.]